MTDDHPQIMMLVDPTWTETPQQPEPAPENVVGAWLVGADGAAGAFESNPGYAPSRPGSPTDPLDALLQALARDGDDADELAGMLGPVLGETRFAIAVDDDGAALVRAAPDGSPAVLVVTARTHRGRVDAPGWRDTAARDLATALPETGIDVLVNPGAPASMLVHASALRDAVWSTPQPAEATERRYPPRTAAGCAVAPVTPPHRI
ncbi:type VII secretion system-associated protein [Pseudonocardia sp. ICBG1122]|nr:type VII secretion system-associated protein [Pseudonocardia pini]